MSASANQRYCYRCRTYHPAEEMKMLVTKTGTRWRCIKSLRATQVDRAERDAYGRAMTAQNRAESQAKARHLHPKLVRA